MVLTVDLDRREVRMGDVTVEMRRKEYELVAVMSRDPTRAWVVSELLRQVWGHEYTRAQTRTCESHACRARKQLRLADPSTAWLENVWGVGYRLTDDPGKVMVVGSGPVVLPVAMPSPSNAQRLVCIALGGDGAVRGDGWMWVRRESGVVVLDREGEIVERYRQISLGAGD